MLRILGEQRGKRGEREAQKLLKKYASSAGGEKCPKYSGERLDILIPLQLIHSSRDAIRKAREAYLTERGQTLEPKGINKREKM